MKRISECELCGSKNATRKTKIGTATLTACEDCVKFGQEIASVELIRQKNAIPEMKVLGNSIKKGFHQTIQKERAKKGLTQEELAKKLNEKSSLIKRVEEGWEPPESIVKKLERFFGISITEDLKEERLGGKAERSRLTIGDVAEVG